MSTYIQVCVEGECENEAWSRGLCPTHYSAVQRAHSLSDYPTKAYMDDPEAHIRWAFAYHPELVRDIAIEYGMSL